MVSRQRWAMAVGLGAMMVAAAGCSSDGNDQAESSGGEPVAAAPKCHRAGSLLVSSLESSITANGGGSLKNAQYVKVVDGPEVPLAGFKAGTYVVSAKLNASGIDDTLSWAVSKDMLKTGGGLALGVDPITREFSDAGAAAGDDSPARAFTDAIRSSDAYDISRDCAGDE